MRLDLADPPEFSIARATAMSRAFSVRIRIPSARAATVHPASQSRDPGVEPVWARRPDVHAIGEQRVFQATTFRATATQPAEAVKSSGRGDLPR